MVRSNQFLQKLPNTSKYVKSVFFNPILVVVFVLLLGFNACSPDEDHAPDPIHVRVGSPLRDFLFFKEGSYWIYKSNDGLYDTVTVTSYKVDTLTFVDEKGRLISTQEYFWFDYFSSIKKEKFTISRSSTSPYGSQIVVYLKRNLGGEIYFLVSMADEGKRYCGSSSNDCFEIKEKTDTIINGNQQQKWSIWYKHYALMYSNQPVVIDLVSGIGITKKETEFENRTWSLIDYYIIQ